MKVKKIVRKTSRTLKFMLSRKAAVILLLLVQAAILIISFSLLKDYYKIINLTLTLLGIVLLCYIINTDMNPAYKIAWIIPLLILPVFTTMLYVFLKAQVGIQLLRKTHRKIIEDTKPLIKAPEQLTEEIKMTSPELSKLTNYMWEYGNYSIYKNSRVEYFKSGEEKFHALKRELRKAKKFIFIEYFIIDEGKMWDEILEILIQKVAEGVDVRVLYDGFGSQMKLPDNYHKQLLKLNIKCKIFNKFRPLLSSSQNNRDHRKIVVVDGMVAFTGGINLADEYINEITRFGHWKDTAIMVTGEAVWSFTVIFLQLWLLDEKDPQEDFESLKPHYSHPEVFESDGFVMPYADSPIDNENVGELVYMDIINNAKDYVYIMTPYLVIDNEMATALGYAAKCGVDVRIMMPSHPDKWYVHFIGQANYKSLLKMGIKIYEYSPGFLHAKSFVSDDTTAVVGTINLDYRSLFLHFECAAYMYKNSAVMDVKQDFLDTLEDCVEVDLEFCKKRPLYKKIVGSALKMFAPLV